MGYHLVVLRTFLFIVEVFFFGLLGMHFLYRPVLIWPAVNSARGKVAVDVVFAHLGTCVGEVSVSKRGKDIHTWTGSGTQERLASIAAACTVFLHKRMAFYSFRVLRRKKTDRTPAMQG